MVKEVEQHFVVRRGFVPYIKQNENVFEILAGFEIPFYHVTPFCLFRLCYFCKTVSGKVDKHHFVVVYAEVVEQTGSAGVTRRPCKFTVVCQKIYK